MRRDKLLSVAASFGFIGAALWLFGRPSRGVESGDGGGLAGAPFVGTVLDLAYSAEAAVSGAPNLALSAAGLDAIKQHERFVPHVYLDQAGRRTIGYGHLIKPSESFPGPITEERGREILADDVQVAESAVRALVKVPLSQGQYDALVSFAFNVGTGAFRGSTLLDLLNRGDYAGAQAQFARWNKVRDPSTQQLIVSNGLANRRAAEAEMFA